MNITPMSPSMLSAVEVTVCPVPADEPAESEATLVERARLCPKNIGRLPPVASSD